MIIQKQKVTNMKFTQTKHGKELIDELISSSSPVPLATLQEHLKLSRRSIFYTIKQTNLELVKQQLDEIENLRGSGYQLSQEAKRIIKQSFSKNTKSTSFTSLFSHSLEFKALNKHDRQLLIHFTLICRPSTSLNQFVNFFNVSKNTILKDLLGIKKTLPSTVRLSNGKTGKFLAGDEVTIRRWVFENFRELLTLITPVMSFSVDEQFNQQLKLLERITGNSFTDESMRLLNTFIKWSSERIKHRPECILKNNNIKNYSLTYTWATSFLNDVHINSSAEAMFLAEIVSTQAFQHLNPNNVMIAPLRKVSSKIIQRFNEIAGVNLPTDDDTLNKNLTIHLVSTYCRVKYNIKYQNPLVNKIRTTYKETFQIVKLAINPFNQLTQRKLSDDEIALITVYFSGALRQFQELAQNKAGVLVICSSGIGTSELLISQLRSHYPDVNFIGPYNTFEYENMTRSNVKLVLSTIRLPQLQEGAPVITVPVIPDHSDWQQISTALQKSGATSFDHMKRIQTSVIMDIVANHTRIVDPKGLEDSLRSYINNTYQTENASQPLTDIVYTTEVISKKADWKTAVHLSLMQLEHLNVITKDYVTTIIDLTKKNGDYMAIGNGVFLAHATPKAGVNRLGFSYTLFKHPFYVKNSTKPINFVVGVAPTDQQAHLPTLGKLLRFIQNDQWVGRLHSITTADELKVLLTQAQLINK